MVSLSGKILWLFLDAVLSLFEKIFCKDMVWLSGMKWYVMSLLFEVLVSLSVKSWCHYLRRYGVTVCEVLLDCLRRYSGTALDDMVWLSEKICCFAIFWEKIVSFSGIIWCPFWQRSGVIVWENIWSQWENVLCHFSGMKWSYFFCKDMMSLSVTICCDCLGWCGIMFCKFWCLCLGSYCFMVWEIILPFLGRYSVIV